MSNDLKKILAISVVNALAIYFINQYFHKKEQQTLNEKSSTNGN